MGLLYRAFKQSIRQACRVRQFPISICPQEPLTLIVAATCAMEGRKFSDVLSSILKYQRLACVAACKHVNDMIAACDATGQGCQVCSGKTPARLMHLSKGSGQTCDTIAVSTAL